MKLEGNPQMPPELMEARCSRMIGQCLDWMGLDLSGLTVLTEAATGFYAYTPLICLMAGAEKVFALAKDSGWGKAAEIEQRVSALARSQGLDNRLEVVDRLDENIVSACDIITNHAPLRPITGEMVSWMKPTCVIPLMWEAWEFRPWELDIGACREKGILVMGTDEDSLGWGYTGLLSLKLLQECEVEILRSRVLAISSLRPGRSLRQTLSANGAELGWTGFDPKPDPEFADSYFSPSDEEGIMRFLATADAVVCDERKNETLLIGTNGIIDPVKLAKVNPGIVIINRSGMLDMSAINSAGLHVYPRKESRKGFATVYSYYLGPRPIFELNTAGLKVGEAMARARLAGMSPAGAARASLAHSPAQDFPGEEAWSADLEREA